MNYTRASARFVTPRGQSVKMTYRQDTNDWNTTYSCLTEDEYGLRELRLTGRALDIGGYTGGVTVALAVDNPELHVTVVEPVPDNLALIRENVEQNGVADRVTIIAGAVGTAEQRELTIHYGYTGSELAEHHAFVGNISLVQSEPDACPSDIPHEHVTVPVHSLASLLPADFVKIDCEGGEWAFLTGPVAEVPRWVGEWHPGTGHTQADFIALFPDYAMTFAGPLAGPQGFEAVRL